MSWSPGNPFAPGTDPMADIIQGMVRNQIKPQITEIVVCAKCKKLNYWDKIRKILDERGDFIDYRCISCVTEGNKL